jgi:hypothetical protein
MSKRLLPLLCCTLIALSTETFAQEADPAEVAIGERLFLETRFSQFFAAQSAGNANGIHERRPVGGSNSNDWLAPARAIRGTGDEFAEVAILLMSITLP